MNAKHLFLTLTMLLASLTWAWGETKTDAISLSVITTAYGTSQGNKAISSLAVTSDARYAGQIYCYGKKEPLYLIMATSRYGRIMSTTSGGIVTSVKVTWAGTNTASSSGVRVVVRDTPFTGSETIGDIEGYVSAGTATELSSITYDGSSAFQTLAIGGSYHYVAILSVSTQTNVSSIDIIWTIEDKYNIAMDEDYDDWEGEVQINEVVAEADAVVTKAKAGDDVEIKVTPNPDDFYYIDTIIFGDMVFAMGCATPVESGDDPYILHVTMPAKDVEVRVVFAEMEFKDDQGITFKYEGSTITSSSIESGVSKTYTFNLDYYAGTDPEFLGAVSYSIANPSVLSVDAFTYNSATGEGSFTVTGFIGSTNVEIVTAKTILINASDGLRLPITVNPKAVALVAEDSGDFYAVVNSISDGKAVAQEIFSDGDKFYFDVTSGTTVEQMTWYVSTLNSYGTSFAIQNEANKFLAISGFSLILQDGSYTWYKNGDKFINEDEKGIIYEGASKFFTSKTLTTAAKEAHVGEYFLPLTYSTSDAATILDTRTLSDGSWGTICVPFDVADVSAAGAEFYTLTGKHVEDDNIVGFYISDAVSSLTAGHSYLYQVSGGSSAINLNGSSAILTEAVVAAKDGFVGVLPNDNGGTGKVRVENESKSRVDGNYVMSGGKFRYLAAGGAANVKAYRAYVDASELDAIAAAAPGRRLLRLETMVTDDQPTDIVINLTDEAIINWNEPVYNIMGMQVGKGATGVLIQNGQKFIVQ